MSEMERDQEKFEMEDELDTEILENYGVDIRNEMNIATSQFEADIRAQERAIEEMSRVNSNYSEDLDPLLSATPRNDIVALSLVPNQPAPQINWLSLVPDNNIFSPMRN